MKNYKKIGLILLALVAVLSMVISSRNGQSVSNGDTIKIGSIGALSGVGSLIGIEERNGALLAIEEINSKGGIKSVGNSSLELVSEDLSFDKMKNSSAVASKLISVDKVVAVVGPQWDEPTEAVVPIFEAAKVPLVSGDVTNQIESKKNYEYLFSTWFDNRVGIKTILQNMKNNGIKNVAVIRPIDAGFWKFTADLILEYAPSYSVNVVSDHKLSDPFTMDYRTTLAKIKSEKVDAIFIVVTDPTQCPFLKQVKELSLNIPIYGTEAMGSYASLGVCADLMEQTKFTFPKWGTLTTEFNEKYKARFGRYPLYPSAITMYDAVGVIANSLEKTHGKGGEILQKAIQNTSKFKGASQNITFDGKGFVVTPDDAFEIMTVRKGAFVKAN